MGWEEAIAVQETVRQEEIRSRRREDREARKRDQEVSEALSRKAANQEQLERLIRQVEELNRNFGEFQQVARRRMRAVDWNTWLIGVLIAAPLVGGIVRGLLSF